MVGGAGNDRLIGGRGDDILYADQGVDFMNGGVGYDLYQVSLAANGSYITDPDNFNSLLITGKNISVDQVGLSLNDAYDQLHLSHNNESLVTVDLDHLSKRIRPDGSLDTDHFINVLSNFLAYFEILDPTPPTSLSSITNGSNQTNTTQPYDLKLTGDSLRNYYYDALMDDPRIDNYLFPDDEFPVQRGGIGNDIMGSVNDLNITYTRDDNNTWYEMYGEQGHDQMLAASSKVRLFPGEGHDTIALGDGAIADIHIELSNEGTHKLSLDTITALEVRSQHWEPLDWNSSNIELTGQPEVGIYSTGKLLPDSVRALKLKNCTEWVDLSGLTTGNTLMLAFWLRSELDPGLSLPLIDLSEPDGRQRIQLQRTSEGHLNMTLTGAEPDDTFNRVINDTYPALSETSFIPANTWVHTTLTMSDTGFVSLYRNGELSSSFNSSVLVEPMTRAVNRIGRNAEAPAMVSEAEGNATVSWQEQALYIGGVVIDKHIPSESIIRSLSESGSGRLIQMDSICQPELVRMTDWPDTLQFVDGVLLEGKSFIRNRMQAGQLHSLAPVKGHLYPYDSSSQSFTFGLNSGPTIIQKAEGGADHLTVESNRQQQVVFRRERADLILYRLEDAFVVERQQSVLESLKYALPGWLPTLEDMHDRLKINNYFSQQNKEAGQSDSIERIEIADRIVPFAEVWQRAARFLPAREWLEKASLNHTRLLPDNDDLMVYFGGYESSTFVSMDNLWPLRWTNYRHDSEEHAIELTLGEHAYHLTEDGRIRLSPDNLSGIAWATRQRLLEFLVSIDTSDPEPEVSTSKTVISSIAAPTATPAPQTFAAVPAITPTATHTIFPQATNTLRVTEPTPVPTPESAFIPTTPVTSEAISGTVSGTSEPTITSAFPVPTASGSAQVPVASPAPQPANSPDPESEAQWLPDLQARIAFIQTGGISDLAPADNGTEAAFIRIGTDAEDRFSTDGNPGVILTMGGDDTVDINDFRWQYISGGTGYDTLRFSHDDVPGVYINSRSGEVYESGRKSGQLDGFEFVIWNATGNGTLQTQYPLDRIDIRQGQVHAFPGSGNTHIQVSPEAEIHITADTINGTSDITCHHNPLGFSELSLAIPGIQQLSDLVTEYFYPVPVLTVAEANDTVSSDLGELVLSSGVESLELPDGRALRFNSTGDTGEFRDIETGGNMTLACFVRIDQQPLGNVTLFDFSDNQLGSLSVQVNSDYDLLVATQFNNTLVEIVDRHFFRKPGSFQHMILSLSDGALNLYRNGFLKQRVDVELPKGLRQHNLIGGSSNATEEALHGEVKGLVLTDFGITRTAARLLRKSETGHLAHVGYGNPLTGGVIAVDCDPQVVSFNHQALSFVALHEQAQNFTGAMDAFAKNSVTPSIHPTLVPSATESVVTPRATTVLSPEPWPEITPTMAPSTPTPETVIPSLTASSSLSGMPEPTPTALPEDLTLEELFPPPEPKPSPELRPEYNGPEINTNSPRWKTIDAPCEPDLNTSNETVCHVGRASRVWFTVPLNDTAVVNLENQTISIMDSVTWLMESVQHFLWDSQAPVTITGSSRDDTLELGKNACNVSLSGGAGNDVLINRSPGHVVHSYRQGGGVDLIEDYSGHSLLDFGENLPFTQILVNNQSSLFSFSLLSPDALSFRDLNDTVLLPVQEYSYANYTQFTGVQGVEAIRAGGYTLQPNELQLLIQATHQFLNITSVPEAGTLIPSNHSLYAALVTSALGGA